MLAQRLLHVLGFVVDRGVEAQLAGDVRALLRPARDTDGARALQLRDLADEAADGAGGPEKCRWVVETLGFDACIDYKSEDVKAALKTHCPKGVDVYFDNVGGEILDIVLTRLARGARIVICGAVSQYNATQAVRGPSNYLSLLVFRATMAGMVVFDYAERFAEAMTAIAGWMGEGRIVSREHIVDGGVDAFPQALLKLFAGENTGKLVLRVA